MKWLKGLSAALMVCATLTAIDARAAKTKSVTLKEGAVDLIKVPGVKLFLVKDNKVVGAQTTENPDEILVSGKVFGKTQILCWDDKRDETTLDITVQPRYWDALEAMLRDYPQVRRQISGEKIILSGKVRQGDALQQIAIVKGLDPSRIIDNVSLSTQNLTQRLNDYFKENGYDDVSMSVIENTIFLSGEVTDQFKKEQLLSVVKSLSSPYKCELNTAGLIVGELSKLLVNIQFLEVNNVKERNVGVTYDSPQEWSTDVGAIADAIGGSVGGLRKDWEKIGFSGKINTLRRNNETKIVYETSLSTNSGEKATFQQGGTFNRTVYSEYTTGIHEIQYGFIINTTPKMLNRNTIETDVKVQLLMPNPIENENDLANLDIRKYSTSSKYNTRPGESMLLSVLNHVLDGETKRALPLLTYIPVIGEYMGNFVSSYESKEVLLVIRVDLKKSDNQVELDKRMNRIKALKADPEMP